MRETDEADGFEAFYKACKERLLRYVLVQTNNGHYAEDIVQEVMITLRRYWGRYKRPEILMFQMAKQELGRWSKKTIPNQFVPIEDHLDGADEVLVRSPGLSPVQVVDERDRLTRLLRRLPTRQREVVVLIEIVDLDILSVCEVLGISPSAVKTHHSRGIAMLRTLGFAQVADTKSSILGPSMEGIPK